METETPDTDNILTLELPEITEQDTTYLDLKPEENDFGQLPPDVDNSLADNPDDAINPAENVRGTLDNKGNPFDPAIHLYPPEQTPTGRWKRIPKKQREEQDINGDGLEPNAELRLEAQKFAMLYGGLHVGLFGADLGAPESQEHVALLTSGIESYFQQSGVVEMPAEINLLLSCGLYTIPIVARETNKDKIIKWVKTAPLIGRFFNKKKETNTNA